MIGGGIKKGIGKLGEMGGDGDGEGYGDPENYRIDDFGGRGRGTRQPMPMTPGFNPNASMPSLKAPMMGGDSGTIGHDSRLRNPLPQLQRPGAPISVTPQQTQMIAQRPIGEVRPPDFLGRKGATMDDTPLNHERYAYDNQYMKDGRHPRRWQDIAMTALHGANEGFKATGDWRGALAGAGTGAAGAAISPLAARDLRFEREQLPGLERSRADLERGQDRQRKVGMEDYTMGRQRIDDELRRRESEKRIENYDVDNKARQQQIDQQKQKFEYEKNRPLPPRPKNTYMDQQGYMRDKDTNELQRDPQTKQPIRGYEKPESNRPIPVAAGGTLYFPGGKTPPFTAPKGMSNDARDAQASVSLMKRQAMSEWSKAQKEKDPAKRAELENNARYYQEEYNNAAIGLAEDFPDDFEAGDGEGGWSYFKPKGSTPTIKRGSGGGKAGGTAKLSDLKKLLQ